MLILYPTSQYVMRNLSLPVWLFLFNIQAWNLCAHFKLLRKEKKLKAKEKTKDIPTWMQSSKE